MSSRKHLHLVDAGLAINTPFPLVLPPTREVHLILSFDFSAGDPFEVIEKGLGAGPGWEVGCSEADFEEELRMRKVESGRSGGAGWEVLRAKSTHPLLPKHPQLATSNELLIQSHPRPSRAPLPGR